MPVGVEQVGAELGAGSLRTQQVAFALTEGDVELRVRRVPGADGDHRLGELVPAPPCLRDLLVAGAIDAEAMLTLRIALDSYQEAIAAFRNGDGLKIQVTPAADGQGP